jgi:hypothetical protein
MFKEDEGLSTYAIADFLATRPDGGRFISIEYDPTHIQASRAIIERLNPKLHDYIDYREGHSLHQLPPALADLGHVHFASLDGGAHPEVCLVEFEQTMAHLAPLGTILVDDAQRMEPTVNYSFPRPLGKATLILPMLVARHYVQNRDQAWTIRSVASELDRAPGASFVHQLLDCDLPHPELRSFDIMHNPYGGRHLLLVYGELGFMQDLPRAAGASRSLRSRMKNRLKQIVKKAIS